MPDDFETTNSLLREISSRMRYLLDRANQSLVQLHSDQIWYRPHINSNAIGNIILHIVGNLKQWIMGGVAGLPDARNRSAEFNANNNLSKEELIKLLNQTIESCCKVIEELSPERILHNKVIQELDVTIGYAMVMAVSHTGLHIGQMQYITKMILADSYKEATSAIRK